MGELVKDEKEGKREESIDDLIENKFGILNTPEIPWDIPIKDYERIYGFLRHAELEDYHTRFTDEIIVSNFNSGYLVVFIGTINDRRKVFGSEESSIGLAYFIKERGLVNIGNLRDVSPLDINPKAWQTEEGFVFYTGVKKGKRFLKDLRKKILEANQARYERDNVQNRLFGYVTVDERSPEELGKHVRLEYKIVKDDGVPIRVKGTFDDIRIRAALSGANYIIDYSSRTSFRSETCSGYLVHIEKQHSNT